jgi:hypothetical protein
MLMRCFFMFLALKQKPIWQASSGEFGKVSV